MRLVDFHKLRRGVQLNAYPGADADLRPLLERLRGTLAATRVFESVEVGRTEDPDHLLIALCRIPAHVEAEDAARAIEQVWEDHLRYRFWESHATLVEKDHVEFQGATRADERGHYATVHIVVQKETVPAQRVAAK
jgi:hypothetical protein